MELIKYKEEQIKELQDKIEILKHEIDIMKAQKTENVELEKWYSLENKTVFFKPDTVSDGYISGMAIKIENDKQFPRVCKKVLYREKYFYDKIDKINRNELCITYKQACDIIDEYILKLMNYYFLNPNVDELFDKLK